MIISWEQEFVQSILSTQFIEFLYDRSGELRLQSLGTKGLMLCMSSNTGRQPSLTKFKTNVYIFILEI